MERKMLCKIDFENRQELLPLSYKLKMLVRRAVETTLDYEQYENPIEVSVTFTDNEEIRELNRKFRNIDRPTDVLSFECDGLDDDFDGGAAYDDAGVPDDEPFMLGDIIIASDYARAQTAQFGTTPQEELAVLLVHGLLHLCGWDHVHSDEEAEAMEAREREMLAGVGLPNIR